MSTSDDRYFEWSRRADRLRSGCLEDDILENGAPLVHPSELPRGTFKVSDFIFGCPMMRLEDTEMSRVDRASKEISHRKGQLRPGDEHYGSDGNAKGTRFTTGLSGEMAVLKYLGLDPYEYLDVEVGSSVDKHVADLREIGIDVGIKSVTFKNVCPLVPVAPLRPELMCMTIGNTVYFLGLAPRWVQAKFSSMEFVKEEDVKEHGTKVGFYGFHALEPMEGISIEALRARYPLR